MQGRDCSTPNKNEWWRFKEFSVTVSNDGKNFDDKQEMKKFARKWWYWICISLFTLVVFLHKNEIVDTFGTVDACVQRFIITPFNNWVAKKEFEDVNLRLLLQHHRHLSVFLKPSLFQKE